MATRNNTKKYYTKLCTPGAKLFILYNNDICSVYKLIKLFLFADDTNIFCSANDIKSLENIVCNKLYQL